MCLFKQPKIETETIARAPAGPLAPPEPPKIGDQEERKSKRSGRNSLRIDLAGGAGNTSVGRTGLTI